MKYKVKIQELRKEKGLSQQELADKLNISQMMISKYENKSIDPSLERLVEIASILDVSLDELVEFNKIHDKYSKEIKNKW
ncbi:HTH-type transcriptional regulator immR [Acholeplasma hippikon]|uniref:HTH-type transcriptional regulator immR n=2 Tax=Acholeplasma hippikon TaxID=264636 RepID=A0A449BK07_9MOLU|nr:HTH-type transcriptional regulator immR [Acholeplasma hippikon]